MSKERKDIDQKILNEILEAVGKLQFGEVVITVHDSKVVQIEKKKKRNDSIKLPFLWGIGITSDNRLYEQREAGEVRESIHETPSKQM